MTDILSSSRPDGNFLIDHHPNSANLFLATGGCGHGFKFFPIIGEKIVDAIEGTLAPRLREKWKWRAEPVKGFEATDDPSRSGKRGMTLSEELKRAVL